MRSPNFRARSAPSSSPRTSSTIEVVSDPSYSHRADALAAKARGGAKGERDGDLLEGLRDRAGLLRRLHPEPDRHRQLRARLIDLGLATDASLSALEEEARAEAAR